MAERGGQEKALTGMGLEQLQVYARELGALFQSERQARLELERKQRALEQKIGELEALNQLFQGYLRQRLETEQAYREVLDQMENLLARAGRVRERTPPPSIPTSNPQPQA